VWNWRWRQSSANRSLALMKTGRRPGCYPGRSTGRRADDSRGPGDHPLWRHLGDPRASSDLPAHHQADSAEAKEHHRSGRRLRNRGHLQIERVVDASRRCFLNPKRESTWAERRREAHRVVDRHTHVVEDVRSDFALIIMGPPEQTSRTRGGRQYRNRAAASSRTRKLFGELRRDEGRSVGGQPRFATKENEFSSRICHSKLVFNDVSVLRRELAHYHRDALALT
jgi:hypothetical protein